VQGAGQRKSIAGAAGAAPPGPDDAPPSPAEGAVRAAVRQRLASPAFEEPGRLALRSGPVDLDRIAPDPRLVDAVGAEACLARGLLPLCRIGGTTLVAAADPAALPADDAALGAALGRWRPVPAERGRIEAALDRIRGPALRAAAERLPDGMAGVRDLPLDRLSRAGPVLLVALAAVVLAAPLAALAAVTLWAALTLAASTALRLGALVLELRRPPLPPATAVEALPVISIIVPLFREPDIAPRLLRRLGRLDYPRSHIDVVLAVEAGDRETRAALVATRLPPWMRTVVVPDGPVRTKPRAMNYALGFCRGSIVGVYDAEDAPQADQLRRVAAAFAAAPADLACLQGVLDYYNPRTNWIARCFTVEYAAWFRVILPAVARLGLPVPLGGTTMFVRRDALDRVGRWDAWNVTEDADLGIRLARGGYRTAMLASTTEEEANCRLRPWLSQRSRWIKGHLLTWAVHMRDPRALRRDLGWRGFLGYQVLFLGAQSQVLLAPLMMSLWLVALGVGHPLAQTLAPGVLGALLALFLVAEVATIGCGTLGAWRTRHDGLWRWAPTLHVYLPLAAVAGWRAVGEVFTRPFYWAKTAHGAFDAVAPRAAVLPGRAGPAPSREQRIAETLRAGGEYQRVRTAPASIFRRVSKAREIWMRSAS
jgi:cellulose synthase/poly-beta-1,6-N-acetylglucosamine synthase-like glycosyltransferase